MTNADSNIVDARNRDFFDLVLESKVQSNKGSMDNLASLLFKDFPHRKENCNVIIGHIGEQLKTISLKELRIIVGRLYHRFIQNGIKKGDRILLASFESNNEIYIAILFLALSSYGVEVFLPMYLEKEFIEKWYDRIKFNYLIFPEEEVKALKDHQRQKDNLNFLREYAEVKKILCLDIFKDLSLHELLDQPQKLNTDIEKSLINEKVSGTSISDIALLITTSGTSGISKIVFYDQGSFLQNISAWERAGLYKPDKLGGRGFSPLFTHTMGIRTFLNGLWTGNGTILINTEWFSTKPETVRYLLLQSKPEHVTGGSAIFNMFIEMSRIYPDLKKGLRACFKNLVSSGATITEDVKQNISRSFDIQTQNAFGTTETQQVLSTLVGEVENNDLKSLGNPLPGVSIGLKKVRKSSKTYKLFIKSQFGATKVIDEKNTIISRNKYLYLGDTVKLNKNRLYYKVRAQEDYHKDDFGVKIPIKKVQKNYSELFNSTYYVKIFPLKFTPGLGVLIFLDKYINQGHKTGPGKAYNEIHNLIERLNHEMYKKLEPIQFNHWTIKRFSCISEFNIENKKGIISDYKVQRDYKNLITELTEDNKPKQNIIEVRSIDTKPNSYSLYHNPHVGKLLECLDMDVFYESGKNDSLIHRIHGQKNEVLDLTGGYGTNLLGHHNDELTSIAIEFLKSNQIPLSDQLSLQKYPALLAEKLNELLSKHTQKSYYTQFGSTGSEAVEMAIHHSYLEWMQRIKKIEQHQVIKYSYGNELKFKKIWENNWSIINNVVPAIIANKHGFHGNSSSARSLLGDKKRREKFRGILKLNTIFIDDTKRGLKTKLDVVLDSNNVDITLFIRSNKKIISTSYKLSTIIAAIVEPVIGEGGIREVNSEFPKLLAPLEFPLIVDEIQSGLGRTGSFLSSQDFIGNYYLFSKALGGNIAKISAISIEKERYIEKFGKLYVSTFSGGGLAAKIALENLNLIEKYEVPKKAGAIGNVIINQLKAVKQKHPNVIEDVLGKGLMIGIKFSEKSTVNSFFLRTLYNKRVLGYLFSSYLLNRHNIRILPSLSAPNELRIEPSICITPKQIMMLVTAIDCLAELIEKDNTYNLVKHLMKGDPYIDNKGNMPKYGYLNTEIEEPSEQAAQVAFIGHFAYPMEELRMLTRDLNQASDTGLRQLFTKFMIVMDSEPLILHAKNIFGGRIHLTSILLPLDSSELEKMHKTAKRSKAIKSIQKAVDMAASYGAKTISLGGYTSIVTNNGKRILPPAQTKIVTGNTLTAVVGYHNFLNGLHSIFEMNKKLTIGVVGANGNIGSILAKYLYNEHTIELERLCLFGKNLANLKNLKNEIQNESEISGRRLFASINLKDLRKCDAFILAINTNDPIVYPEHIRKDRDILISDLSVPTGISEELKKYKNIHLQPFSSSINLVDDPDFLVTSCSPRGTALCCISETFLNAFEKIPVDLRGDINVEGFNTIYKRARKYGFIKDMNSIRSFKTSQDYELSI